VLTADIQADHEPTIAVIGGGASGTLTAVHLLRRAAHERVPLRIALLDRTGRHGLGQAYSTTHPGHLLNSPAGRMSALADDPGHLVRWAQAAGLEHDGFVPRWAYGRYLRDLLADAQDRARQVARLSQLTSEVVAIGSALPHGGRRLHLAEGGRIDAEITVLATGSPGRVPLLPATAGPRYIADPWAPGALDRIGDGSPVLVLGTGLTMIDVALSATRASPRTVVYAVSRHGLLPRAHVAPAGPGEVSVLPVLPELPDQPGLAPLIRYVRTFVAQYPGCWQDAVDALRPAVPLLWARLPAADKRLFVRHVARHWEVHRHRMPPATAARIAQLRGDGRLRLIRGRIGDVTADGPRLRARIDREQGRLDLTAGWVVDATGPAADITSTPDPLIGSLLADGLARPDPLRLGIDADRAGAVIDARGRPSADFFTLGPTLRGVRYETTAIAEIKDQAAALAGRLIDAARSRATSGTAA
jgi:uncharacterized NAD(P)/FAD-binding protein YdhS